MIQPPSLPPSDSRFSPEGSGHDDSNEKASDVAQSTQSASVFAPLLQRVIVLTGPTASGKTELALRIAEALTRLPGGDRRRQVEIISLDSIAVYRGMDVGSAKPSVEERKRVVHHLLDIVSPSEEFSVAEYMKAAHRCVSEIERRGNVPMFVGGTPMYLKGILRGLDPGPPADEAFRRDVEKDVAQYGIEALRERLRAIDPLSAARIEANDTRRMIRALEFVRATGTPISHHQTQFDAEPSPEEGLVFAIRTPRGVLHQRIEARVEKMFASGLVEEVRGLVSEHGTLSKTACKAVGYRELIEAIEQGRNPIDAMELVVQHTRRLARRQETWLRSFSEVRALTTHEEEDELGDRDARTRALPLEKLVDESVNQIITHPIWQVENVA